MIIMCAYAKNCPGHSSTGTLDTCLDVAMTEYSLDGLANAQTGEVNGYGIHAELFTFAPDTLCTLADGTDVTIPEGGYIRLTDAHSFVSLRHYSDTGEARKAFDTVEANYEEWCDSCEPKTTRMFDRTEPEAIFPIPKLRDADSSLLIKISAAGGGAVGRAYADNDWIWELCENGYVFRSGSDLHSGAAKTHAEMALALADFLDDPDPLEVYPIDPRNAARLGAWASDARETVVQPERCEACGAAAGHSHNLNCVTVMLRLLYEIDMLDVTGALAPKSE